MAVKVKLIGLEPKRLPCDPQDGWYELTVDAGTTVTAVIHRFGLKNGAISVLKNGLLASHDDIVTDQDELQMILKSLGG